MQELSQPGPQRHGGVSAGLLVPGVILVTGTAVLAARLTWEMTSLTWQQGPQMVGFSLAHGYGAILFFFPIALSVWLLVFLVVCVVRKARRRNVGRLGWSILAVAALTLGVLSLPQGFWDRIFVSKLATSPKSSEFLVRAAGNGELHTVKALIAHGVPIQSTNYEGSTALHYSACAGESDVVRYLIKAGANVNALNLYGDSPLVCPEEKHNEAIVTVLKAAGGQEIRGSEEQHQRASKAIVDREIEEQRKRFKEYAK